MCLREEHTNGVCRREKSTKASALPLRTPEVGKNQCDGAGGHDGATGERAIIAPLLCVACRGQGEGQRNQESNSSGGCV